MHFGRTLAAVFWGEHWVGTRVDAGDDCCLGATGWWLAALSSMIATGHVWLFKFNIKSHQIKWNSSVTLVLYCCWAVQIQNVPTAAAGRRPSTAGRSRTQSEHFHGSGFGLLCHFPEESSTSPSSARLSHPPEAASCLSKNLRLCLCLLSNLPSLRV